jgi:hypothetical protein
MMSALISADVTPYRDGTNMHLSRMLNICRVLNIKVSNLMVDNTKVLNPKILYADPPEFVKRNAVRFNHDENWHKKQKEKESWFEQDS